MTPVTDGQQSALPSAASLFASSEPSIDLFGDADASHASTDHPEQAGAAAVPRSVEKTNVAADLFGGSNDTGSNFFDITSNDYSTSTHVDNTQTQHETSYDYAHPTHDQGTHAGANAGVNAHSYDQAAYGDYNGYAAQGWYDEHGQWQTYDQSYGANNWQTDTTSGAKTYSNDPYAPQTQYTPPAASYSEPKTSYTALNPTSQAAYDPYAPKTPATSAASPYAPPPASSPYVPTPSWQQTTAYSAPPTKSTFSLPQAESTRTNTADAALKYRPTTYNAYDPPVLPSKRASSVFNRSLSQKYSSSSLGGVNGAYGAHGQAQQGGAPGVNVGQGGRQGSPYTSSPYTPPPPAQAYVPPPPSQAVPTPPPAARESKSWYSPAKKDTQSQDHGYGLSANTSVGAGQEDNRRASWNGAGAATAQWQQQQQQHQAPTQTHPQQDPYAPGVMGGSVPAQATVPAGPPQTQTYGPYSPSTNSHSTANTNSPSTSSGFKASPRPWSPDRGSKDKVVRAVSPYKPPLRSSSPLKSPIDAPNYTLDSYATGANGCDSGSGPGSKGPGMPPRRDTLSPDDAYSTRSSVVGDVIPMPMQQEPEKEPEPEQAREYGMEDQPFEEYDPYADEEGGMGWDSRDDHESHESHGYRAMSPEQVQVPVEKPAVIAVSQAPSSGSGGGGSGLPPSGAAAFDPYRPRHGSLGSGQGGSAQLGYGSPPPKTQQKAQSLDLGNNRYAVPPPVDGFTPAPPATSNYYGSPYAPPAAAGSVNAYPGDASVDAGGSPAKVPIPGSESSPYGSSQHAPSRYSHNGQPVSTSYGSAASARSLSISSAIDAYEPYSGAAPASTTYAPSPSLTGANDPLGRTSVRVPVFTFGFGGKVVSCFHLHSELSSGFDVSLSSRHSTSLRIRPLKEIIPASVIDSSSSPFPGPLFAAPTTPTITAIGRNSLSSLKTKKPMVVNYLTERAEEIERGLGYLGASERRVVEGKLVLVKLLKVLVENDGKLSGSPQIENAVRASFIPALAQESNGSAAVPFGFSTPGVLNGALATADTFGTHARKKSDEAPLASYEVRTSALETLKSLLLRGERRDAYRYALDQKLWAHAMIISGSVDKEASKEVASEFIRSELGVPVGSVDKHGEGEGMLATTNGWESLRVAYSLFAGQGAAAVQELLPPKPLTKRPLTSPLGSASVNMALSTSNGTPLTGGGKVPSEALAKWQETAAAMLFTQVDGASAALTALGDLLISNKMVDAAHACFLLSPKTSVFAGVGSPSVKMVLVGSANPSTTGNFHKDQDPVIFSEIVEFALSLAPVPKGQEPFVGLPHLQPYRLLRAAQLAEMGHVALATRYCEAITAAVRLGARGSPYYTSAFAEKHKELYDRLTGAPQLDSNGSWISKKVAKPSLDSIGSWVGGRLTKFIAGDSEGNSPAEEEASGPKSTTETVGPFSHFSAIASSNTSPTASVVNLAMTAIPSQPPLRRAGSSIGMTTSRPPSASPYQTDRASSAMDHRRPNGGRSSPAPRVFSPGAAMTAFRAAGGGFSTIQPAPPAPPMPPVEASSSTQAPEADDQPWWGSSGATDNSNGVTPTTATFQQLDVPIDASGFISPMDAYSPGPSPSPSAMYTLPSSSTNAQHGFDDDEEDLGFGNSKPKKKTDDHEEEDPEDGGEKKVERKASPPAAKVDDPKRPDAKPNASGGSWFGRWWGKKEGEGGGPVKASLGEESSFYYDKELKRWVNKKVGGADATPPPTPPPPPSRAQTASPGRAMMKSSAGPPSPALAPPPRPQSTSNLAALGAGPPPGSAGGPRRVRSHLAESFVPEEPPSGASNSNGSPSDGTAGANTGLLQAPPPPRTKSAQGAKRNVRSRYVDVFQTPPSA
ncbi:hypothetical protein BOTBODRAFT_59681 [Botryobasidium botryosum FD-172 SS1]|uniref:Protein transport protein sec16 n=1 Tax=Botryobasidium botryosum (strain FD-172 SS1) TaxID=930990 RepID=A0A067LXM3_BOTB1|nr:hypothetical protein BOTBODRAFT_59681 [Botryobasidium botryosum FD-172 SS1]